VLRPWPLRYVYNLSREPEALAENAGLLLLLVPGGLIALWGLRHPARFVPLAVCALFLSAPVFWIWPRFLYPTLPALCVLAGIGGASPRRDGRSAPRKPDHQARPGIVAHRQLLPARAHQDLVTRLRLAI